MQTLIGELERIMNEQIALHDRLLNLITQKLAALRKADQVQIPACTQAENEVVQKIGNCEQKRLKLVAELTRIVVPDATQPIRLRELAPYLDEPGRGHLLVLRQQLEQKMHQVRHQAGLTRRATESLSRHFQGLMQTITMATLGAGTYGRQGVPPPALSLSTFNATA